MSTREWHAARVAGMTTEAIRANVALIAGSMSSDVRYSASVSDADLLDDAEALVVLLTELVGRT